MCRLAVFAAGVGVGMIVCNGCPGQYIVYVHKDQIEIWFNKLNCVLCFVALPVAGARPACCVRGAVW